MYLAGRKPLLAHLVVERGDCQAECARVQLATSRVEATQLCFQVFDNVINTAIAVRVPLVA